MDKWRVGDFTIERVIEFEAPVLDPYVLFPRRDQGSDRYPPTLAGARPARPRNRAAHPRLVPAAGPAPKLMAV